MEDRRLLAAHQSQQPWEIASQAVQMDPLSVPGNIALGHAAAALGKPADAHQADAAALTILNGMDESARAGYMEDLKQTLHRQPLQIACVQDRSQAPGQRLAIRR